MDRNLFENIQDLTLVGIVKDLISYSESGKVDLALGSLVKLSECSGGSIQAEEFIGFEREIYNDTVELSLNYAKIYLTMGCKSLGVAWLDEAKKYADKIRLDISDRIRDIGEIFES